MSWELQKWPLLTGGIRSERHKLPIRFPRDELKLAFVERKPLLAGVLVDRCPCRQVCTNKNAFNKILNYYLLFIF